MMTMGVALNSIILAAWMKSAKAKRSLSGIKQNLMDIFGHIIGDS
jgi:hypothetical protein